MDVALHRLFGLPLVRRVMSDLEAATAVKAWVDGAPFEPTEAHAMGMFMGRYGDQSRYPSGSDALKGLGRCALRNAALRGVIPWRLTSH